MGGLGRGRPLDKKELAGLGFEELKEEVEAEEVETELVGEVETELIETELVEEVETGETVDEDDEEGKEM